MENKARNELEINLGGNKILLRPTFENMAAMESDMGSIASLAFKFGKGVDAATGKVDPQAAALSLPSITETTKIFYYNQAEKKYSLEEMFEMVMAEGIQISIKAVMFLTLCTAGNKFQKQPTKSQKKS